MEEVGFAFTLILVNREVCFGGWVGATFISVKHTGRRRVFAQSVSE